MDTWYGGRSTDYRNSTARIENATAHIDYYLQTIEFQIRLPGIEDLYDNISRSRLLSLADDTDGEGGFRTVEDWRTSASPDLQLMQFVIAMAQTISVKIPTISYESCFLFRDVDFCRLIGASWVFSAPD